MKQSKAQAAATQRFEKKAYDKVMLRLRKDSHPNLDDLKAASDAIGESVNGYIKKAIQMRIDAEKERNMKADKYMNIDTGETFTLDELRELYEQFKGEMKFDTFGDFLEDDLLKPIEESDEYER